MDLIGSQVYRLLELNEQTVTRAGITGIIVESANLSDIDFRQFMEPRALGDGMDSDDAFLGRRQLVVSGQVAELTHADFHDLVHDLRLVMSTKSAMLESPSTEGYLPYYFSVPTNDPAYAGIKNLKINVIPHSFSIGYNRDKMGGDPDTGLSASWQANLLAKDPFIYAATRTHLTLPSGGGSTTWTNRGDFPAKVNLDFHASAELGVVTLTIDGEDFDFALPAGSNGRRVQYFGAQKLLYINSVLQMDAITFDEHPEIPQGSSVVSVSDTSVTLQDGDVDFTETYA